MLKIKEDCLSRLEDFGFSKSWVAVYPEKMVRVADWKKRLIVEVGISHPVINMWDRKDKNGYRQIKLWKCYTLNMFKPAGDDTEHIYYEADETINEELPNYIKDLIEADMVVEGVVK